MKNKKGILDHLYEHLKTKKKYNTLMLKYEVTREDLEKKQVELNTERRIHMKQKEVWEQKLKEQEEKIAELKKNQRKKVRIKNGKVDD